MAGGRPTVFSDDLADDICAKLAEGKSLASICRENNMPSIRSVYGWLRVYPEFLQAYTRAREDQADTMADIMTDIADTATADTVQQARLRIDTRKWIASKLKPKKYGDKLGLTDGDGGPLQVIVQKFKGDE